MWSSGLAGQELIQPLMKLGVHTGLGQLPLFSILFNSSQLLTVTQRFCCRHTSGFSVSMLSMLI